MDNNSQIPKSRTSSLLKMAAKVALKEGKKILNSNPDNKLARMIEQADIIVQHVGQLKGAAMKAVQMLSIEGQDFLPAEVIKVLEKLQSQAPPLSHTKMMSVIKEQLGEDKFNNLKNISKEPIASASIGQVYQAQLGETDVVVKVQYPGIAESVDSDIAVLKKLVKALVAVSNKKVNFDELFDEVQRILKLETDYTNEAQLLKQYKKAIEGHSPFRIPDVFEDYTSQKVIVMSKEDGLELTSWLKTSPSVEKRKKVGHAFLDLYMIEFFQNQLVQTDPNPANFLINDKEEVILLDFGATISYDSEFVHDYKNLVKTVFTGTDQEILDSIIKHNFISAKESAETKMMFVDFLRQSMLPFAPDKQPFDFSEDDYSNDMRTRALEFSRKIKHSAPPKQLIFLHRKLGGIFQFLRKLEVKVDLSSFRNEVLNMVD